MRLQRLFAPLTADGATKEAFRDLDPRQILDEFQSFVTYAGALARYFWPVRKEYAARGEHLRKRFGITDDNPLANKELRNRLEHFDERLDEYLKGQVFGIILPDYVGPSISPGKENGPDGHLFRAYFTDTGCFVLLNEQFDLPPLIKALFEIAKELKDKDLNGAVMRFPPKGPEATA